MHCRKPALNWRGHRPRRVSSSPRGPGVCTSVPLRLRLCSREGRNPNCTQGLPRFSAGACRLRSSRGSARTSPSRRAARTSGYAGKSRPASRAAWQSCARGGRSARACQLTASLRRRGRPHAPAAPPVPHSISKITHTCAGKQAREPAGPRVPGEPKQRAPSSRTCRPAPPAGFCAARPRPALRAPPTPPLPGPEALAPAVPAGSACRGSASFLP